MTISNDNNWREIVDILDLAPHPEGGFYRETFRDTSMHLQPERTALTATASEMTSVTPSRAHSTAIYFLLPQGVISHWHRVDAAEVWHWYAGAPLELSLTNGETSPETATVCKMTLGTSLTAGERPQHVIPPHVWQQARSLGAWTLVGCTVAPGFEFTGFEIAPR